jgi:hypothetical protein
VGIAGAWPLAIGELGMDEGAMAKRQRAWLGPHRIAVLMLIYEIK